MWLCGPNLLLWSQATAAEQRRSRDIFPLRLQTRDPFPAARPKLLSRAWEKSISLLETTICPKDVEEPADEQQRS